MWKSLCLYLSNNRTVCQVVSKSSVARRAALHFVAGETLESALKVTRQINSLGASVELDYLGGDIASEVQTRAAADTYLDILNEISQTAVNAQISPKPSQMGQGLSADLCYENIERIVEYASLHHNFVWIDMESALYTWQTVCLYNKLLTQHSNVGLALQANLRRCEQDVKDMITSGGTIRLCKGGYRESPQAAFTFKGEIDWNYLNLARMLLSSGHYHAFATHDEKMIAQIASFAKDHDIQKQSFEFQMAYGVRPNLQKQVLLDGYRLRVYVPYGHGWFPYFMRRLAMRPTNLMFLLGMFQDPLEGDS
jgi:proline dehydrogenase